MGNAIAVLIAAALGAFGVTGVIIVVVLLNPEKVQIWISWLYRAARLVVRKAEYGAIAYDVAGHLTEFYNRAIISQLDGVSRNQIKVRWANTPDAIATLEQGTLIVRMRPHDERMANVFHASMAAFPILVAPTVRHDLRPEQTKAIDIQLCRSLAARLGATGAIAFRAEILEPLVRDLPQIARFLDDFQSLELGGLFVPVFLQELIRLAHDSPHQKLTGLASEIDEFVAFLKAIAEREPREIVDLSFLGTRIKINVLLVAHADTKGAGVWPYQRRIGIELGKGVDTVYLMATAANFNFAAQIIGALDADRRLIRRSRKELQINRAGRRVAALIVPFDRNAGYSLQQLFEAAIAEHGLRIGSRASGIVTDIQPGYALIDVDGVQTVLPKHEAGWGLVESVATVLAIGESANVEVISLDPRRAEVQVSRRRCIPNPTETVVLPDERLQAFRPAGKLGYYRDQQVLFGTIEHNGTWIPAALPSSEAEWGSDGSNLQVLARLDTLDVLLVDLWRSRGVVIVSRKRAAANKWTDIRDKYRRDARLEVIVSRVSQEGTYCEVEAGLVGFVPADEFRLAGLEFADFERNVAPGQTLFVYVRSVVGGNRQRLVLGLQRNQRRAE